jgi:hypothetical protein
VAVIEVVIEVVVEVVVEVVLGTPNIVEAVLSMLHLLIAITIK